MAAIIRRYDPQVAQRVTSPTPLQASQTSVESLAEGIDDVADAAFVWQEELDTADAKRADMEYADFIRDKLYNAETGYMFLEGRNAISARESLAAELDKARDAYMGKLGPGARKKAQTALQARGMSALETIDRHAAGAHRDYVIGTADARMNMFLNDATMNPSMAQENIQRARAEFDAMVERTGMGHDEAQWAWSQRLAKVHVDTAERMAVHDANAALAYLNANREELEAGGADMAALEKQIIGKAKEQRGRLLGSAAANRQLSNLSGEAGHSIKFEYQMGPARPYAPNEGILNIVGRSVEQVLGKGARVVVTSGQEGDNPQHGSNRHKTGNAVDFRVVRADGSVVSANDPEMAQIARAAAANGAVGIGFGSEYMGGTHMHIDLVPPGAGQGHVWASGAKAIGDELVGLMKGGTVTFEDIMSEEDPEIRDWALQEFETITRAQSYNRTVQREQLTLDIYESRIIPWAQEGAAQGANPVNGLSAAEQKMLGPDGVDALRTIAQNEITGVPYVTDAMGDRILTETAELVAQAEAGGPQAAAAIERLRQVNPLVDWRLSLSDGDYKTLVSLRAKAINPTADDPADMTTFADVSAEVNSVLSDAEIEGRNSAVALQVMQWRDNYIRANNGKAPTEVEMLQEIRRRAWPITIDPWGPGNRQDGSLMELDFGEMTPGNTDDDLTIEDLRANRALRIRGEAVPVEDIDRVVAALRQMNPGREPTPREVVEFILNSGAY